ncbi:hypothetical protein OAA59_02075 [bacterium]|nr:hypothetical protein [bacterium]
MKQTNITNFIESVFIVEPVNRGWILEKLVRDIADQMRSLGIEVRIGPKGSFRGEMVALHTRGYYFQPIENASLNSVFMTHIDDVFKEKEMVSISKKADSVICMSEHNAEIMWSLGCSRESVIGINLPHRGGEIRRPRIGIFSAKYPDGRKNEEWLIDYYRKIPVEHRSKFIICLIGRRWEMFGALLADLDASFEIYRYDRSLPGEYDLQKDIVAKLDKLVYLGFDGGSMSVYDGMHANVDMIFSDNCFHRNLDDRIDLFSIKEEFFSMLDDVVHGVVLKEESMRGRSVEVYTTKLLTHWKRLISSDSVNPIPEVHELNSDVFLSQLKEFRDNYRKPGLLDALRSYYRFVIRFLR